MNKNIYEYLKSTLWMQCTYPSFVDLVCLLTLLNWNKGEKTDRKQVHTVVLQANKNTRWKIPFINIGLIRERFKRPCS